MQCIFPAASEENNSIPGVGVDKLLEVGKLEKLRNGPLYWVDSADSHPRIGQWLSPSTIISIVHVHVSTCIIMYVP